MKYPIFTGTHGKNHLQGIAVDEKKGFIYYSFTTKLIKARLDGTIIGSVDGFTGHLGCIAFNKEDGRVYGSLEYKNDAIGRGIHISLGIEKEITNAFYMTVFDVDKIDRMDMDAASDGIVTAAYLKEVADDYNGTGTDKNGAAVPHRYGCSGIDGTAIGPIPGSNDGKNYLFVAYGIYSELNRSDNDHQVLLCYDIDAIKDNACPLTAEAMHTCGPKVKEKYFVYTGNTNYGVQNLEYAPFLNGYVMAVYRGYKPEFANFDIFIVDAGSAAKKVPLKGVGEEGMLLTLKPLGEKDESCGVYGYHCPVGSTGFYAMDDGTYLISQTHSAKTGQCGYIFNFAFDKDRGFIINE